MSQRTKTNCLVFLKHGITFLKLSLWLKYINLFRMNKVLLLTVAVGILRIGLVTLLTETCLAVIEVVVAVVIIVDPVLEVAGFGTDSLGVSDIKMSPTCSL